MTLAPETTPREATGETAPLLEARNLLMDEAFSALDPLIRREMQEQLVELQRKLGRTIVFITHDLNEAMFLGDRIAVMRDGRIVQNGTPEEILADPANDYVAQFVQDVDRARVLTAASVMEPPHATMPLSAETVVDSLGDAPGGPLRRDRDDPRRCLRGPRLGAEHAAVLGDRARLRGAPRGRARSSAGVAPASR